MDQPLDRRATLRRFALPAVVCTAILAVGYLRTAEGTRHPSPWGYRLWSFGALAYSDILALHEDRGATTHKFPYLKDKVEYPVLMGLGMWWPSALAPDRAGYFAVTFLALALCALGTLWVLSSLPQATPWAWAASPALLVYTGLNWDLFGILPLAVGLWLWAKLEDKAAVAVLTLAVWTKFFPLLVLGLVLLIALRHKLTHALALFGIFVVVTVVLNAPFALAARENWEWFFRYNQIREIEPSLYLLAGVDPRGFAPTANLISAAVTLAVALALAIIELVTKRLDLLRASCGLMCVFFLANKVFSPQYWLWVVALAALAGLPGWLSSAVSVIALGDFVASFSRLHIQSQRVWPITAWFDRFVFFPTVGARYAALAACAVWALAHSVRGKVEI
ncbi:MAG: hypothetical protein LC689_16900 [Myxococcales bacterium]|nr:hypothetical protein [Myxococcales bacterium]